MTITDFISKRTELRQLSINNRIKKKRQKENHKSKPLHTSVLDLLHWHPISDITPNKNINQQLEESLPYRPSIIKSSDVARVLSKKSVTFASTSNLTDDEHDQEEDTSNLEENTNNEMTSEDLVIVISNNQCNEETTIDSNEYIEPYPFRSETPLSLSPQSNSPIDVATSSQNSRKKIIQHFIYPHRPKKLRHPIQTPDPVSTMNRSNSAPNLIISSSLSIPSTTTNDQQRPLKTIRTWFKSSPIARFVQSFNKNPTKTKFDRQSSESNRFSELIY